MKTKQAKQFSNILFLTGVHGNERLGAKILKKIEGQINKSVSWLIGNEEAFKKNQRFVDKNLNRVAPGDETSKYYEVRRANEILQIAKAYDFLIDLHSTKTKTGIFTIVTNPKKKNLLLASELPVQNIVIWTSQKTKPTGPITRFVRCGVEIEAGPGTSLDIQRRLFQIVKFILESGISASWQKNRAKNWFRVYGKVKKGTVSSEKAKKLKDFQESSLGKEKFYPLLTNQYPDIICYKMKKIA